jgi:hypothetical protein
LGTSSNGTFYEKFNCNYVNDGSANNIYVFYVNGTYKKTNGSLSSINNFKFSTPTPDNGTFTFPNGTIVYNSNSNSFTATNSISNQQNIQNMLILVGSGLASVLFDYYEQPNTAITANEFTSQMQVMFGLGAYCLGNINI